MIFNPSNDATAAAIGKFCNVPSAMIPFLSSSLIFVIFDTRLIPTNIVNRFKTTNINDDLKKCPICSWAATKKRIEQEARKNRKKKR